MSSKELLYFRDLLITGRTEIHDRIRGLDAALRSLSERESEVEEEAQKATISEAFDRLGLNGKLKIEMIDLALRKMTVGDYGICESCGDDIALKRLEALPWSRLCVECARDHERRREPLPLAEEAAGTHPLPDELQGMTGDQLIRRVRSRLEREESVDLMALKIYLAKGAIYLEGTLSSHVDHETIMQILTDEMGFTAVVDLVHVEDADWAGVIPPSHLPISSELGDQHP